MAPKKQPLKPYTSLLTQNGNFGDMFWPKEHSSKADTKRVASASSLAANAGSMEGDDGESAGLREELNEHLNGSCLGVKDKANVSVAGKRSL